MNQSDNRPKCEWPVKDRASHGDSVRSCGSDDRLFVVRGRPIGRINLRQLPILVAVAVLLGISQTTAANASTSFIGRSQNNSDHPNTTVTLNTPTAIANGDLMLVFMVAWNSSPATPSNWTKLAAGVNSAVDGIFAYYKFWHIGDPSSYTFGGGSTNYPKAVMRVYRGVSSIDAASQAPVNAGSNTYGVSFYLPSLSATTTASEGYVGFYASPNTGGTISGPADLTDTITNQTQWASFDGDKQIANAGIIPPTEPALISTAGDWIGFDITLKPKASPTPTPTPTPTGTPTPTPTPIPTATASPTPTATFSPTPTPAPTSTPSPNPTPTSSPTPGGTFPQFGNTGQTLAGYTAGTSLFVRSMFGGDIFTGPYDTGYFNNIIPDVRAAQINTLESSFLRDATGNCISSNFALTGGGGTWQTNPCGNWHDAVVNGYFIPALKEYQTYGIPWLIRDDAIQHSSAPYYSCGSTIGSCINLWPEPLVADYTSILNSYANQYHMFVGQMSPDEFGNGSGNENGATSPYYSAWLRDLGMAGTGGQHVAYGEENLLGDTTNSTNPLYSDWYTVEVFDGNASWSNLVNNMHNGDQYKHIITAARGATAGMTVNSCEGPTYQKKTNDTQYTPGSDTLEGTWDTTWGAGAYLDLAMYAVAHGFAGIRTYQFDYYTAYQRLHDPIGTQNIETACSPVSAATGGKMAGGANGRGQDRWYAMSAAYNVIHAVEAYALQPTMAPPNQAQACDYDASVSTAGDPILCGAHQGNGGRLVVIMNVSPSASTFTFNPASYVYPGGTAQSWVLVGSTDGSCGEQTTTADAGVPGINDCVKGPTTINGVRWEQGTTMPAAGGAPTRTTNIGSCSGQMCPTEVDVFLYHQ